ncbi:hypothetical protein [Agaribacterium sp. ZY112]|uniref:Abi-alpha family protein n=1 Tax=Agaribacterium sp. ZY112 TaxID=3233574 RepID=UPI0035244477
MSALEKLAEKVPEEVYLQATDVSLKTFQKLIAPVTETTDGLGRYIRQRFDNMVAIEKALAVHALERACSKVDKIEPLDHPKSFIVALDEASKETDEVLSEMWINLLSCQLSNKPINPSFSNTLSNLGRDDAILLDSITSRTEYSKYHQHGAQDLVDEWVIYPDSSPQPWSNSCTLLCQLKLADVINTPEHKNLRILVRTKAGDMFLEAVSGRLV